MTLADLLTFCRIRLDDQEIPYLWDSAELTVLLNEAVQQATMRGYLIKDSSTPALCRITLVDGQEAYPLDGRILRVDKVRDADRREWRKGIQYHLEQPKVMVVHDGWVMGGNILTLTVSRLPMTAMINPGDTPELPSQHHLPLVEWVVANAIRTNDNERDNQARAMAALVVFERHFGTLPTAAAQEEGFMHIPWIARA